MRTVEEWNAVGKQEQKKELRGRGEEKSDKREHPGFQGVFCGVLGVRIFLGAGFSALSAGDGPAMECGHSREARRGHIVSVRSCARTRLRPGRGLLLLGTSA